MLTITVPGTEYFDEKAQEFVTQGDFTLELEHSLVTLSKWEAFHEKPFLSDKEKTTEETISYVELMIQTPNVPKGIFQKLSAENVETINDYISSNQSATWFSETNDKRRSREVITSELIYYWMITFNIPMECENWHINRLFTLIKICNAKQEKPKKMSRSEMAAKRRQLNDQRRSQLGTKG